MIKIGPVSKRFVINQVETLHMAGLSKNANMLSGLVEIFLSVVRERYRLLYLRFGCDVHLQLRRNFLRYTNCLRLSLFFEVPSSRHLCSLTRVVYSMLLCCVVSRRWTVTVTRPVVVGEMSTPRWACS